MVQHYYSLVYYLSRDKQLLSFTDSDLRFIISSEVKKEFNHDDNYGGYF